MSHHPIEDSNRSNNPEIWDLLEQRVTRRSVLKSGGAMAITSASGLSLLGLSACSSDSDGGASGETPEPRLAFTPVAKSLEDRVILPPGYSARVLYALGDPLVDGLPEYPNDGSDDGNWDRRAGDHHDAIAYFPLPKGTQNSDRGVLVMNHEALTDIYLHENGPTDLGDGVRPLAEVIKEQFAHGVAVIEVARSGTGDWAVDRSSDLNRRWHVNSEMEISGPARGSSLMTTPLSPNGITTFGTLNDCGHGVTPWGTYLAGEENWFAYFTLNSTGDDTPQLARYGIASTNDDGFNGKGGFNYRGWDTPALGSNQQRRFNASRTGASAANDFRNEPHHFGYAVEIDPYNPNAKPKKRTAIGRLSHEGVWFAPAVSGQPLVAYTGDDSRNEYIFKFVSDVAWNPADASLGIEGGDKYLDAGTLYAARFNGDGTGDWLPLTPDNPDLMGMSAAEIAIYSRIAADRAGATKMDRPEWGGVNPRNGEVYFALTNSSSGSSGRGQGGGASQPRDAANPRSYTGGPDGDITTAGGNVNGHVIRWRENGVQDAVTFVWDIYAFGARADYAAAINLSNLDDTNDFSSPDGLWFDKRGILWLQTDDGAYTDTTNCMMLAATPGTVGDGGSFNVPGADGETVTTFIGDAPGESLRRFLVGVSGCEITGVETTPDYRTMFVNIQHPGERGDLTDYQSSWPYAADATLAGTVGSRRPRTATIVITRDDGGEIAV
ncbi:MAG: PhoX family phosphatase [Polycyclovorans sp.]